MEEAGELEAPAATGVGGWGIGTPIISYPLKAINGTHGSYNPHGSLIQVKSRRVLVDRCILTKKCKTLYGCEQSFNVA